MRRPFYDICIEGKKEKQPEFDELLQIMFTESNHAEHLQQAIGEALGLIMAEDFQIDRASLRKYFLDLTD